MTNLESHFEDPERRQFFGWIGAVSGLVGAVTALAPKYTHAFDWDISTLYARSNPAYHVMPGLRFWNSHNQGTVRGEGTTIKGGDWNDYYWRNPDTSPKLKGLFRDLNGQQVSYRNTHFVFSSDQFEGFMEDCAEDITYVNVYKQGFIRFRTGGKNPGLYTLPIPQETARTIIDM